MNLHKNYLKIFFFFSVVFLLLFIVLMEMILFRLGESGNVSNILEVQQRKEVLFGRKYSSLEFEYKVEGARFFRPEILILGTSRIMQIGQHLFLGKNFYNSGISASASRGIDGMILLLNSIPKDAMPDQIIVGLDPWLFNPNYPENKHRESLKNKIKIKIKALLSNKFITSTRLFRARQVIYSLFIKEEKDWFQFVIEKLDYKGFGLNAKKFNSGFRVDGSYQYPKGHGDEWKDDSIDNYIEFLKNDNYRFPIATNVDQISIERLIFFLDLAEKNKIKVIGLLPPFSPNFNAALISMKATAAFYRKYQAEVNFIFKSRGLTCYNFCDINKKGLLEKYKNSFSDRMHPKADLMAEIMTSVIGKENIIENE